VPGGRLIDHRSERLATMADGEKRPGSRTSGSVCHHRFAAQKRDLTKSDLINYLFDKCGLSQSISITIIHEDWQYAA